MKSLLTILALVVLTSAARAQEEDPSARVKTMAVAWVKMINGGIADQAGAYMTESYFVIDANGQHVERRAWIERISKRKIKINDFKQENVQVTSHGLTMLMSGVITLELQGADGKEAMLKVRFLDVWVKKDDKWKAAASTYSRVSE